MKMRRSKKSKALALLLSLAMLITMFPSGMFAAAGDAQTVTGGINGFTATLQADESTAEGYKTAFGSTPSADYNGKVWADKSVEISDDDKTFDVTLSALGQTYATTKTTQTEVAFDVVFVVDVSPSMNYGMNNNNVVQVDNTRMKATVDALNSAADKLMENADNRMAVVAFGGDANQMVSLSHYDQNGNRNFFSYSRQQWSEYNGTLSFNASGTSETQNVISSTDPQAGLFEANDILTGATIPQNSPTRIPVVILLTDGEPNDSTSNYKEGTWWDDGSASASNLHSEDYYYTICTAAYTKDQITDHYKQIQYNDEQATAKFYTIGLGLEEGTDAEIMLDPSTRNTTTNRGLSGTINDNSAQKMGFSNYNYADESYIGEMTADDLQEIFNSIIGSITSITGGASVGEEHGNRNSMHFYETLGDGVSFTGEATLTVPTYTVNDGKMEKGEARVYELQFVATDSKGGVTAGTVLTGENGPAYIEAGGVAKAEAVRVNDGALDQGNAYDKSVQEELDITVQQLENGKRQMNYYIPPQLMAYNVLNTTDEETTYFESEPVKLTYGVQLRNDTDEAGSYLIGEPGQTYMEFYPSTVQEDGKYQMPYYNPGGQFEQDEKTVLKTGEGVAGADTYVTKSQFTASNSVVRIDLGNNGLYIIDGKAMTFHLFWNDANDQDGQRPDEVKVQLYQEFVKDNTTDQPDSPANNEKYGKLIPLNISSVDGTDPNQWTYTTTELPVYGTAEDGNDGQYEGYYVRYWMKFDNAVDGYSASIHDGEGHSNGHMSEDGQWFCFDTSNTLLNDAKLDVQLTHETETVSYTVEKQWVDVDDQPDEVEVQLYANGVPVNTDGSTEDPQPFSITKVNEWKTTLSDLPKNANGAAISYGFAELNTGDVYDSKVAVDNENHTVTITNTNYNSLGTTEFTAQKIWDDNNNQDGVRPGSVDLTLTASFENGSAVEGLADKIGDQTVTQTANEKSEWKVAWTDLPKTIDRQKVVYNVTETKIDEYDAPVVNKVSDNFAFVTNTHKPATTDLTVTKNWTDKGNAHPDTVTGKIYQQIGDGAITATSHTYTSGEEVANLPVSANGETINYYVSENPVSEYKNVTYGGVEAQDGTTVYAVEDSKVELTNEYIVTTQGYTANFTWVDEDESTRPDTIEVTLKANNANDNNLGSYTITLTVDENGNISGVKDASELEAIDASANVANGALKLTGLPQKMNGSTVFYQMAVTESGNYTATGTSGQSNANFTLTYVAPLKDYSFTKEWKFDGDTAPARPSADEYAQYLTLYNGDNKVNDVDVVVTDNKDNTYTVTYNNLPENGKYTVQESKVPNYKEVTDKIDLSADSQNTLTNTYEQEVYDNDIVVTKVWDDADGKDKRPSIEDAKDLNIRIYEADAEITEDSGIEPAEIKVNPENENEWIFTWNNVPKTAVNGDTIQYVAHENNAPDGYTASGDVKIVDGKAEGKLTNTLDGGAVATGDLTIQKKWKDTGFEENRGEVTVEVLSKVDGEKQQIVDTITLNGEEGIPWTTTLKDQPITSGGKDITYSVRETKVPAGYTASVSAPVTLTKEGKTLTVTNTYSAEEWTVTYNGNGGTTNVVDDHKYTSADNKATVKAPGDGTVFAGHVFLGWSMEQIAVVDSAENVPGNMLKANDTLTLEGNTTLYAVWAIDANEDGKPDYDQTSNVTVNVVWKDDGNRCGIRPTDIGFTLKGEEYTIDLAKSEDVRVNTNEGNTMWIYTVPTAFDKDAAPGDGDLTAVDVQAKAHADENDKAGYTQDGITWDADSNTYTITLSHTPETTKHHVTKTWDFGKADFTVGNAEIQLLANGQPAVHANGDAVATITFESNGNKDLTWDNLPKYEGGQLISYHAIESKVLNGQDDVTAHFKVDYDWSDPNKTVMTNTYSELRDITLLYTWDDDNNVADERPTEVTVQLYNADTNEPVGDPATISESTQWSTTWVDLPIYDVTTQEGDIETLAAGDPINYEARVTSYVDAVGTHAVDVGEEHDKLAESNYSFDVVSFGQDSVFVMNSALDDLTVTATKTWVDDDNAFNTRPASIYISLMQDGTVYQTQELKDGTTELTWDNLPAGHDYTVQEVPVAGYTPAYDGTKITNTLDDLADRHEEYTVTFVYEHASATDADGNAITAPITVKHDGSLQFTAKADSGYILQTPSYNGSATMEANGNTYTLKNIKSDVTVTIKAEKQNQGGGGGGIIITPPSDDDKPELERGDHFAYIVGYEDETIRPQNNITRAEVATIFFRLLTDESREHYFTDDNSAFSDMTGDHWYDNAVATLTNAGIIAGYPDGTFRPNDPITRAEFAAIATRFDDLEPVPSRFTDIDGHWAEDAINAAYGAGWVGGYPDGTFMPNKNITRAEVMSLVNRVLDRNVDIDGMLDDMLTWVDNEPSDWFYEAVQEATNSHDYEREEGEEFETWTKITEPRDWTQLEEDLLAGLGK